MRQTRIALHTDFRLGKVDERIFGGFLEHLGRAVYEGVYQPGSARADDEGFRTDVCGALERLRMTAMRWPGGNFASGYRWTDGVGPAADRPAVWDPAWKSLETNRFGTHEYLDLCERMGWTPMITVNLGTGTPAEAAAWLEYCNLPAGTRWADLRAAHGRREPRPVKLWCLGNEMDGPWQMGHCPPEEYAMRAQQAARLMKGMDPTIELVLCGSCGASMPSYMDWDRRVLEYVLPKTSSEMNGRSIEYVSLHRYVGNRAGNTAEYLAEGLGIDRQIAEMDAAVRYAVARLRLKRRPYLCFDEWNVWYKNHDMDGGGKAAPHLLEEVYNLEDALVVGQFLNSFIRRADVVKIANLAQIVNVIAPILTRGDEMLIQSIFHPFEMISKRRRGEALRLVVDGPTYESAAHGPTPFIDASAILDTGRDAARLNVFAVNRSPDEPAEVTIDLAGAKIAAVESAEILTGTDPKAANSFESPDVVAPGAFDGIAVANGRAVAKLPPLSLAAMTFKLN